MKYTYGIIFWNKETDDEKCFYFEAENYFDAKEKVKDLHIENYVKGGVTFIEDKDKSYYNLPLSLG